MPEFAVDITALTFSYAPNDENRTFMIAPVESTKILALAGVLEVPPPPVKITKLFTPYAPAFMASPLIPPDIVTLEITRIGLGSGVIPGLAVYKPPSITLTLLIAPFDGYTS